MAATAEKTLQGLDSDAGVAALLAGDVSAETNAYFGGAGHSSRPDDRPAATTPLVDAARGRRAPAEEEREESTLQRIASLNVAKRIALAMKGNREERAILIRDPNRIVTAAVLSSPKMTETEVGGHRARWQNVSEDVLRTIANNRAWLKNYTVVLALVKNPKTPVALSMNLMARLNERTCSCCRPTATCPTCCGCTARKKIVIDK